MRSMRMAALAVAMTLMCSGLALARDHDHDNDNNKHDRWDKHADRDRHHESDHDRNQDRNHDRWQDRDHDRNRQQLERDHHWWERDRNRDDGNYRGGQVYNRYPQSYPGGYGYPGGGVYGYPGGGYPSGGYGYPGSVYGRGGNGRSQAYGFGYQDGSYMARRDRSENKRFNPNPRNEYGNRTHGYNSSSGDKNYYRAEYSSGYSAGYEANYRGGRGWGY
jgi:hypothetical protein